MEVVNGIPCFNCTDVEKAKKADTADPATSTQNALNLTASLQVQSSAARSFDTPNDPLADGSRGRVFNFGT
jgi:hypothetical protein